MDEFPPLVLHTAYGRRGAGLMACVFFCLLGLGVIFYPPGFFKDAYEAGGWLLVVLFGFLGVRMAWLTHHYKTALHVDEHGFGLEGGPKSWRHEWAEVIGPFGILTIRDVEFVGASLKPPARRQGRIAKVASRLSEEMTGFQRSLPRVEGMTPAELAALLNRYRENAMRKRAAFYGGAHQV